jgi:hypothetical protein
LNCNLGPQPHVERVQDRDRTLERDAEIFVSLIARNLRLVHTQPSRELALVVVVGMSRETPEFAVDAIEHWWRRYGKKHYAGAAELLILADSDGANSPRCKLWKCDLQQKLCNEHGLRVTVCHYPPGASKWIAEYPGAQNVAGMELHHQAVCSKTATQHVNLFLSGSLGKISRASQVEGARHG